MDRAVTEPAAASPDTLIKPETLPDFISLGCDFLQQCRLRNRRMLREEGAGGRGEKKTAPLPQAGYGDTSSSPQGISGWRGLPWVGGEGKKPQSGRGRKPLPHYSPPPGSGFRSACMGPGGSSSSSPPAGGLQRRALLPCHRHRRLRLRQRLGGRRGGASSHRHGYRGTHGRLSGDGAGEALQILSPWGLGCPPPPKKSSLPRPPATGC